MTPADIFDICLERVRTCQSKTVNAIRPDACAKDGPPRVGNQAAEYVADFELAGIRALKRQPPRLVLFRLYYVAGTPYTKAIKLMKVKAGTFDWWAAEVKKTVGRELAKSGLFPPHRYGKRWTNNITPQEETNVDDSTA
jgi:DNA-directed RNA polymerase specialized sigma24 family protein